MSIEQLQINIPSFIEERIAEGADLKDPVARQQILARFGALYGDVLDRLGQMQSKHEILEFCYSENWHEDVAGWVLEQAIEYRVPAWFVLDEYGSEVASSSSQPAVGSGQLSGSELCVLVPQALAHEFEKAGEADVREAIEQMIEQKGPLASAALLGSGLALDSASLVAELEAMGWSPAMAMWIMAQSRTGVCPLSFVLEVVSHFPEVTPMQEESPIQTGPAAVIKRVAADAPHSSDSPGAMVSRVIERSSRSTMLYDKDAGGPAKLTVEFDPGAPIDRQAISPLATHFPEWDLMPVGSFVRRGNRA